MKKYRWIVVGLLCIVCVAVHCVTRTVSLNGSQQYTSIQIAVSASSPGDTVLVYPGRYLENISVWVSGVTVISLEAITGDYAYIDSTIVDGQAISWGIWVRQNSQNIVIRGFSFTNCIKGLSVSENAVATITNCKIFGNKGVLGAGFGVSYGTAHLSGVEIYNNHAYFMGGGVYVNGYMGSVNVSFDPVNRCSIYNNTAGAGQDIVAHSIENDLYIPLEMFTVPNPTSFYVVAYRTYGSDFQVTVDAHNYHHQEIDHDLYVSPDGNDANDGLTPATALKTIRTAVYRVASDSLNQKSVYLLPGTYSTTANQQVFPIPLKSWVKVQGAGLDATRVVGEIDPNYTNIPGTSLMVFSSFYQEHASLADLSITGAGSHRNCAIWGYKEEALQLKNLRMYELNPDLHAIIHFTFVTNILWDGLIIEDFTTEQKGFMYNDGYLTGTIRNSIFRNATSTFVHDQVWASPLIGIKNGEEIIVENCIFDNLVMMDDDSQALSFGGVLNPTYQQYYHFHNCLFSNIHSSKRGALIVGHAFPEMHITNCTFAGHTGGGEALMINGDVTISNSIFYNQRPKEIAINPMDGVGIPTTLTLNNNLIRNGYSDIWQGINSTVNYSDTNITGNPLFLGGDDIHDPLYYSLSAASPCINSGTPDTSSLNLPPYDLAGNWRVWDGRIDMGCFEYGSEPWVNVDDPTIPHIPAANLDAWPNPFKAFTNIKVNVPQGGFSKAGSANINIYNIKGQKVKTIALDPSKAGEQFTYWDGRDTDNRLCSSGIYLINLTVNGRALSSKKVTLVR